MRHYRRARAGASAATSRTQATRDLGALGVACPRFADYVDRLVAFYRERKGAVRREAMI